MANAQVEKLKALGLRHGEKAVVALARELSLASKFRAATKETINRPISALCLVQRG